MKEKVISVGACCVLAALCFAKPLRGAVAVGDLAIIGYYTDGSATASPATGDAFSWVALQSIAAGEVLYFSDSSYRSAGGGSFIEESLLRLIVPEEIPAGTISTIDPSNLQEGYSNIPGTVYSEPTSVTLTPSTSGDQLVIFQTSNPQVIGGFVGLSAVSSASTEWGASGTSPTESDLYPGMVNGVNALALGAGPGPSEEFDNVRYIGPTKGEAVTLLQQIYDVANWEQSNDSQEDYLEWTRNAVSKFEVGSVNGYDLWASVNAPDQGLNEDHDQDGVMNGIEFFMGETGSSFTYLPGPNASGEIIWPMGESYEGDYGVDYYVEISMPGLESWSRVSREGVLIVAGESLIFPRPIEFEKFFVRLVVR